MISPRRFKDSVKAVAPPALLTQIRKLRRTVPRPWQRARYLKADQAFLPLDRACFKQLENLRLVPDAAHRYGGQYAYGEWCHTIGVFQTLMSVHRPARDNLAILDVGCGTGKLMAAAEAVQGPQGTYLGLDVREEDLAFCRQHYPTARARFIHLDTHNAMYAPGAHAEHVPWPIPEESIDVVTAQSVWTHFTEPDARFYFAQVARVLRPGGVALLTCFLLDDAYERQIHNGAAQRVWRVFDARCTGSSEWRCPSQVSTPEEAIGVTADGIRSLVSAAPVDWTATYPGTWKGATGLLFQDMLVLTRRSR